MPYATITDVRLLGVLRPSDVDRTEADVPGVVAARLAAVHSALNSRLMKRYRTPFQAPYPQSLVKYEAVVVSYELLRDVRGINPASDQSSAAQKAYEQAEKWLDRAVDPEHGDAELRGAESALGAAAINAGGTFCYSEPDAYVWTDVQMAAVRERGRYG